MWPESGKIADDYRSPEYTPGWWARTFPTLVYYPRVYRIVSKAAKLSKAGLFDRKTWALSSQSTLKALESVGVNITIENLAVVANLKSSCVFVGNHMSTLEAFVLPGIIQPYRDVTFVVKKSLIDYPIFKHVMRSCDPVVVEYNSPRDDLKTMLKSGLERLEKDVSLVVFPQGSRTTTFDAADFNSIGVKIAKRASVPIVPVALRTDAWGSNGSLVRDFGRIQPSCPVHFSFGEPMEVESNGRDCQEQIIRFIEQKYRQWIEDSPVPDEW